MLIPEIFYKIGYAICHQLPERSFFVYDNSFPLCARCTGIYIGMFIAFLFYFFTKIIKNKKPILPPPLWVNIFSVSFILLMAFQAISSIFIDYPWDKEIRFITGILFGFSLPWYLFITINYSKRFNYQEKDIISYKEYLTLSSITTLIAIIFLFKISIILYISVYISIAGLLLFIFLINFSLSILISDNIKKLQKISLYYLIFTSAAFSILEIIALNFLHSIAI